MDQITLPIIHSEINDLELAANLIRTADRILVVGCSGGGKSTLSQKIAKQFGLVYVSIDRDVLWLPDWKQRGKTEQRNIIAEKILGERWIMDGTNPSTFDIRLPRTDIVVWVRMPRLLCLWGAISRWLKWIGRTRPELPREGRLGIPAIHLDLRGEIRAARHCWPCRARLERPGPPIDEPPADARAS
jgi:hypothetical protein